MRKASVTTANFSTLLVASYLLNLADAYFAPTLSRFFAQYAGGKSSEHNLQVDVGYAFVDNGNGTISANVTNLLWGKCSQIDTSGANMYDSGADDCSVGSAGQFEYCLTDTANCDDGTTLTGTGGSTISAWETCDNLILTGRSDWRVPTISELETIIDYSGVSPAISATYFPGTDTNFYYSSTALNATNAWSVDFTAGNVNNNGKTNNARVRCVSAL